MSEVFAVYQIRRSSRSPCAYEKPCLHSKNHC